MKQKLIILLLAMCCAKVWAKQDTVFTSPQKQRLDFAKMYFEAGSTFLPYFTGKRLINANVQSFRHSPAINSYLTWGAFHFWGHAEFYVTFPVKQFNLDESGETGYQLTHSVATGARFYPLTMKERKIRPYIGLNWGALDFSQTIDGDKQTTLSKDFMLNCDAGIMYNYKNWGFRLGVNYFTNTDWQYPVSKSQKAAIKTPPIAIQLGLLYTYETSKNNSKVDIDRWNDYPRVSKLSYGASRFGDFFIGAGPSMSFSLAKSEYNQAELPYLKDQLTSNTYFDIAAGYHFNKANLFTAFSYRSPTYQTSGFGASQSIRKNSVNMEVNKFLTDYTGFAPYIGISVAYDHLKYQEDIDGRIKELTFESVEPGLTFGWDIVPGKTNEAIILRTNLRWYPFSKFEVDEKDFNFSQLEYNLIQVIFYPERLKKRS